MYYIKNIIGDMEDNTMDVMGFREKKSNKIIAILFFQKPTKSRNYYNIELLCANRRYFAAGKRLMEAFENRSDFETDWYPISFPALSKNNRRFSYPFLVDIDGYDIDFSLPRKVQLNYSN